MRVAPRPTPIPTPIVASGPSPPEATEVLAAVGAELGSAANVGVFEVGVEVVDKEVDVL